MRSLDSVSWPVSKLGHAITEVGRTCKLIRWDDLAQLDSSILASPEDVANSSDALASWIEAGSEWLGFEAEPFKIAVPELEKVLRSAGPFIMSLPGEGDVSFLAVVRSSRHDAFVLTPDNGIQKIGIEVLRTAVCRNLEGPVASQIDRLLHDAGVPQKRRSKARAALIGERLSNIQIGNCWMLRLPPSAGFLRQLRQTKLPSRVVAMISVQVIQYALLLGSWQIVGRAGLEGRTDQGLLLAWVLLLFTAVPFRLVSIWLQGLVSISTGGLLKQRLLYGALRLDPEDIRHEGSGQLLGRVIESAAVDSLALSGAFLALAAAIEIAISLIVLGLGAGGPPGILFCGWITLGLLIGWRYHRHRNHWTDVRLALTNDLVERMLGHRTRIAQEVSERWHDGEDQLLASYVDLSRVMDRSSMLLRGLIPRGWLLLGFIGLWPALTSGNTSTAALAISIGGILLGYQALEGFSGSLAQLTSAIVAWKQVAVLFDTAGRRDIRSSPALTQRAITSKGFEGKLLVDAQNLAFQYQGRPDPVLQRCSFQIYTGDRILLEGLSGGGKSTLAALLVGLRFPDSGLLLINGLDYKTLGPHRWRQVVTAAPQFHENYVLTGTLAFNLLMGRRWPPQTKDLNEAEALCHELGLGDLLDRMPSRLMQAVGETGWQLSHGERNRLYIARALLQRVDLVVLDESFAALDSETLRLALQCVCNRSSTLLVISQP